VSARVDRRRFLAGLAVAGAPCSPAAGLLTGCSAPTDAVREAVRATKAAYYRPTTTGSWTLENGTPARHLLEMIRSTGSRLWTGFVKHYPWSRTFSPRTSQFSGVPTIQRRGGGGQQQASFLVSGAPQSCSTSQAPGRPWTTSRLNCRSCPTSPPRPGLYTFSSARDHHDVQQDPARPEERPRSLADLTGSSQRTRPASIRLTTYSAGISFGLAIQYAYFGPGNRTGQH